VVCIGLCHLKVCIASMLMWNSPEMRVFAACETRSCISTPVLFRYQHGAAHRVSSHPRNCTNCVKCLMSSTYITNQINCSSFKLMKRQGQLLAEHNLGVHVVPRSGFANEGQRIVGHEGGRGSRPSSNSSSIDQNSLTQRRRPPQREASMASAMSRSVWPAPSVVAITAGKSCGLLRVLLM
jgi:hypothetical protein